MTHEDAQDHALAWAVALNNYKIRMNTRGAVDRIDQAVVDILMAVQEGYAHVMEHTKPGRIPPFS